jgi:hypothetical protein
MVQWDNLGGGIAYLGTTWTQRRGLGRERTTNSSRIRTSGNYSNNKGKVIEVVTPRIKP